MSFDTNEYSCICLQITTKCNFLCSHCYMSCGPYRNEVMSKEVINEVLIKIASKSKKLVISGGEPTLYPKLIEYILNLCNKIRSESGYLREIYLETNGAWAINEVQTANKMQYFKGIGITGLIFSGFDEFHKEFYKGISKSEISELNNRLNLFGSIIFSETKEKPKYLGRGSKLKKSEVFKDDCGIIQNHYYVNVYGDIQICKWGHTCYLGFVLDNNIEQVLNYEFVEILFNEGIKELVNRYNEKFGKSLQIDSSQDVCRLCHYITSEWKRNI